MEQKIVWVRGDNIPDFREVNKFIDKGWIVKVAFPQVCSSGNYGNYGGFMVVMEKEEESILP